MSSAVFLALARVDSLPPSKCSRSDTSGGAALAPRLPAVRRPQLQGIPAGDPLSPFLPPPGRAGPGRGGSTRSRRCSSHAVGVAAPRRASSAVDNGDELEEKGNLRREVAAAAGRERERRVHFCSSVSARRLQRALAREHRGSRSPISGRPEEGSERPDTSAPVGARSRRAWPAREAAGGAPRAGPQTPAGCPTRSCRPCRDRAMAVSALGAQAAATLGSPPPPDPETRWRSRGSRVCASGGTGGQRLCGCKVASWNCKG